MRTLAKNHNAFPDGCIIVSSLPLRWVQASSKNVQGTYNRDEEMHRREVAKDDKASAPPVPLPTGRNQKPIARSCDGVEIQLSLAQFTNCARSPAGRNADKQDG